MAKFGRGSAGVASASKQSGGGKFMPNIKWDKNETKYVQFLQPIEEVLTVYFHGFMVVGTRDDGRPKYRNFVSPKTDADSDGNIKIDNTVYDPLWDDRDLPARKRSFALAVELEPVWGKNAKGKKMIDGFTVVQREWTDKEGEVHEVPAVGLIEGSPSAFYGYLNTFADNKGPIEEVVFQIGREDGQGAVKYNHLDLGPALDEDDLEIPEELLIDLEGYLEGMVMTDEDIAMITALPEDHVFNEFAERNKKAKDKKAKSSSAKKPVARKPKAKVEEEEPEGDPDDEGGEEEPADTKSNRFAQLRRNMVKE